MRLRGEYRADAAFRVYCWIRIGKRRFRCARLLFEALLRAKVVRVG